MDRSMRWAAVSTQKGPHLGYSMLTAGKPVGKGRTGGAAQNRRKSLLRAGRRARYSSRLHKLPIPTSPTILARGPSLFRKTSLPENATTAPSLGTGRYGETAYAGCPLVAEETSSWIHPTNGRVANRLGTSIGTGPNRSKPPVRACEQIAYINIPDELGARAIATPPKVVARKCGYGPKLGYRPCGETLWVARSFVAGGTSSLL